MAVQIGLLAKSKVQGDDAPRPALSVLGINLICGCASAADWN
jgi:hypothetical protein